MFDICGSVYIPKGKKKKGQSESYYEKASLNFQMRVLWPQTLFPKDIAKG